MPLASGTKLGPYEIVSPLGAGGMGEVYRARDTRLDRTVAIKILPSHLSANAEAKQRFEREARAISSLNHAHVCTLYDVGHQDGVDFLVMEHLEGETLADRLSKGPLPPEQLLRYAIEICEGLEKAHRSGVIHRDLKPGNIMLTKGGAKLMDFGLAKATVPGPPPSSSLTMTLAAPAGSHPLTAQGMVVGTFQYMAPEQLEGRDADARSDIFALGAMLYEMATGKRAFSGQTQASIVAAILASEPAPVSTIQPASPVALDRVIKTCLAKDPDERFQTVHDLKLQLKWIVESRSQAGIPAPATTLRRNRERIAWMGALAATVIVAALLLMQLWRQPASSNRVIQSSFPAPDNATFVLSDDDNAGPVVISPQGTYVAFVAMEKNGTRQVWVRALSESSAKPVAGTEGGTYPFWSPDEKWLGFFADGKMKKAPMNGGPILTLTDAPRARGGSWNENGMILFTPTTQSGLFEVAATGGPARQITKLENGVHTTHRWPVWLPGGKRFLYLATSHENPAASEHNGIYVATTDGTENRFLIPADANVVLAPDRLIYVQNGTLMVQPFDATRAQLQGEPAPFGASVIRNSGTWRAAVDASQNGILVYQPGSSVIFGSQLLWVTGDGKTPTQFSSVGPYQEMRLSPDGQRLAIVVGDPKRTIWIYDVARAVRTRFTFEGNTDDTPVWSPDGKRVAFSQAHALGPLDIYVKDAGGSGNQELLYSDDQDKALSDWSPDGRYLLYTSTPGGQASICVLPLFGDRKPQTLLTGAGTALISQGAFSPDGKWVAYTSRESGKPEVYVTSFPHASGKWQVSIAGGSQPHWKRDGKTLMYLSVDRTIMQATIATREGTVEIGAVRPYASVSTVTVRYGNTFELAPDGRALVNNTVGEDSRVINLVLNWTTGMKK